MDLLVGGPDGILLINIYPMSIDKMPLIKST